MDGFFSVSQARSFKPKPLAIARCDECGLHAAGCQSPKMPRAGQGRRNVLVVSEYPTAAADRQGGPLQDGGGRYLDAAMADLGWDMRRDCVLTYAARCAPPGGSLKGRKISPVESCRPFVLADIAEVKPTLIILLGWYAVRGVVGHVWGKEDVGAMGRWAGTRIPAHKPNAWVCPLNHPADLTAAAAKGDKFPESEFRRHLYAALKLADSVPWPDGPPDYKAMVEPIMSPDAAAARLRRYTSGLIAFDYEANCLKPDHADGEIVCASVCWEGQETIAFPWHGAVIPEMKRLLADPNVGKICQNATMEVRWTKAKLGIDVANVVFDTMLGAHAINPRERMKERGGGVTGLKFLAFARLGCPEYASHLDGLLGSTDKEKGSRGGYARNRVWEIDMRQLLIYCGLDSLLEYELAMDLSRELGVQL